MFVDVTIFGQKRTILVDTGATHTILDYDSIIKFLQDKGIFIEPSKLHVRFADKRRSKIEGVAHVDLVINGHTWSGPVYLVKNLSSDGILGLNTMSDLDIKICVKEGILEFPDSILPVVKFYARNLRLEATELEQLSEEAKFKPTAKEKKIFDQFMRKIKNKFKSIRGIANVPKHRIYFKPGTVPKKQRYYPMSPVKKEIAHKQVDELLEKGLIRESESPWSSPILLVEKKNKDFRLCVDYRLVNKSVVPNSYPLPRMREIFSQLKDANYISSLDLEAGYHQIPMHEDSIECTAFTVPGKGLYEFCVMPFGLCNAPASFQSAMDNVLRCALGKFVFVYLDDIIIFSKTFGEHMMHLKKVFKLLRKANLKINWEKCQFMSPYVEYLGHVVGQGEIRVIKKKVDAVLRLLPPKNLKEVRSFMGVVNWYRMFIPRCAEISKPLTSLLEKKKDFKWSLEQQKAFDTLKKCLTEAPVLTCPDFSLPFELHVDASGVGTGAVLLQKQGKRKEQVIAYASRTLNRDERKRDTTERELMAIIHGIETFREYIDGTAFKVMTDHSALQWLHNLKNPTGRLARWIIFLGMFNFTIIHRPGKQMVVPDALSRASYHKCPPDEQKEDVLISDIELDIPNPPRFNDITDEWYIDLKDRIEAKPEFYPLFRVSGNKIFKRATDLETKIVKEKLVVPFDYREKLLEHYHDSLFGGHLGAKKTFSNLQRKYYWPNMFLSVKKYVKQCRDCQAYKASNQPPHGTMADYSPSFKPRMAYSLDLVGPLPLSFKQNRFIATAVDMASRWLVAMPLRRGTAKAVWKFLLENIILQYGKPEFVLADNGSIFASKYFRERCRDYDIDVRLIPKYSPSANQVERHHRSINTTLGIFAKETHRSWDENLPFVVFALRNAISDATGFSPAKLTFGENLRMPYELHKESEDGDLAEFDPDAFLNEFEDEQIFMYDKAIQSVEKVKKANAKRFNLRRRPSSFQIGELVWRLNYDPSDGPKYITHKYLPKYKGPYVIAEIFSPSQVRLETLKGDDIGRWQFCQLKHFI